MNLYTAQSQWSLPRQKAPEAPPRVEKSFIACELLDQVPLASMNGRYSALSYCAGKPSDPVAIMVNGFWFNAFANLEHSLECVRHRWASERREEQLLLWTDQVCINQSDDKEKSQQVGFMRHIYERAQQVFVCLSTAASTPDLLRTANTGMAALNRISRAVSRTSTNGRTSPYETGHNRDFARLFRQFSTGCTNDGMAPWTRQWLDLFVAIVSVPWWTRAWVRLGCSVSASARSDFLLGLPRIHCRTSCLFRIRRQQPVVA